jgi:hypothetical protein
MKSILIIFALLASSFSYAVTYSANTPPWEGEWIWALRKDNVPVMNVNLRKWLEVKPGGWGQSIVNRIMGNAAVAGIRNVRWLLSDGHGNALFPYEDNDKVLKWSNWGVDFSKFDFPKAAAEFADRCGMNIVFVADKEFLKSAQKRYPDFKVHLLKADNSPAISAVKLNPATGGVRWIRHEKYEFQKEFSVNGKVKLAELCVTADAVYRLFIDDNAIGSDGDWWRGETYDVTSLLKPGKHVIRAVVKPSKEYAGFLLNLRWVTDDNKKYAVNTGADWLCRESGSKNWQPVSITGYEGTGPRFRIKDPWMNRRELTCNLENKLDFVDDSLIKINKSGKTININLKRPVLLTEIRIYTDNGAGYQLQRFDNAIWKNIVEKVRKNSEKDMNHAFTPVKIQKLRLADFEGSIKEIKLIKAMGAE